MKEFNLSEWLQDKSRKVVTRDGRSVRIICTDAKGKLPIIALVPFGDSEYAYHFNKNGVANGFESITLLFADEEKTNKILDELKSYLEKTPKEQVEKDWKEIQDWYTQHFTNEKHNDEVGLTEFEKELNRIVQAFVDAHCYLDKVEIHHYAKGLLDLARKEVEKSIETDAVEFAKSYMDDVNPSFEKVQESEELWKWKMSCLKGVNKAYTNGKQDALKALPKLEKSDDVLDTTIPVTRTNTATMKTYIVYDGYKVCINDLFEKLPKEE